MTVAYAAGVERRRWTLREATLPVLVPGSRPLRLLHVSDLHMTPGQTSKQRWVAELAELEPDLVVDTGDNLAHPRAVPAVVNALAPLLRFPGLFVFGSNDYFGPTPKNPLRYFRGPSKRPSGAPLPWRDLRAALDAAWARFGRGGPVRTGPTSTGAGAAAPTRARNHAWCERPRVARRR